MRSGYGVAAAGLLGLGLLAGCSSSSSSDSTPSASAGVEKDASYSSVMALKDAAVAAGLDCADRPADERNRACRQALIQLGEGASVKVLEQRFAHVRYFGCSALGRIPKPGDRQPFEPRGVAEPLFWLLRLTGA